MMSKEFMLEGAGLGAIHKMIHAIKQDCQPYLQEAQPFDEDSQLMRGMHENDFFLKKRIRLDERTPKDIPKELHDKINQYFDTMFGGSFRNALFATGDYIQAENYGHVYYIFPIGDIKYLWNPDIEDLFMNYDEYRPWFKPGVDKTPEAERERKRQAAMQNFFDEEIVDGAWRNTNLAAGISSGMEVMIRAKGYYAVSITAIEAAPEEFFKALQ